MKCCRFIEALALVVLVAAPARADDAFKQHYEAGLGDYNSEDYEAAIKEFQAAYAIAQKPRLLFNIGQAYRCLGNAKEALHFYLLYQALESNPKPGLKSELEGYIAQMKAITRRAEDARRAEDHDLAPAESTKPPPPLPPPPPLTTTPSLTTPPLDSRGPVLLPYAVAPPKPRSHAWVWGVVAGGAVTVVAVGLAVGLTVNQGSAAAAYSGDIRHPTF